MNTPDATIKLAVDPTGLNYLRKRLHRSVYDNAVKLAQSGNSEAAEIEFYKKTHAWGLELQQKLNKLKPTSLESAIAELTGMEFNYVRAKVGSDLQECSVMLAGQIVLKREGDGSISFSSTDQELLADVGVAECDRAHQWLTALSQKVAQTWEQLGGEEEEPED